MNRYILFVLMFFWGCTEAPLITSQGADRLNTPTSMILVPGTNLAIVANANLNLDESQGSLIAVDLATNEILIDTQLLIPSFSGEMFLDSTRHQIYIPDHDESLLVYDYSIPGTDGQAISFVVHDVPNPVEIDQEIIPNGVQTDEGPAQALMIPNTSYGDLIMVTNQVGSVSMIAASDLDVKDFDTDEDYYGLRLIAANNFENADHFPGIGASRMAVSPTSGLVYVSSPVNNQIYILNPEDQTIEAMFNLDMIAAPTVGTREIVIDSSETAYITHSGLDSIIMVDVSGITKNGIYYEVVSPPILNVIPVGDAPEDLELNAAEDRLFVSNQNDDSIFMIDTVLQQILTKTYLDEGAKPGRLVLDESRNTLYSLDLFSNTISMMDATTGERIGEIE